LVSSQLLGQSGTAHQEFATHRQLFLTEQGYRYEIVDAEQLVQSV
jgi:hypothetical protein